MIVTIDGPAGSGKTSIATELAKLLGFSCILTGNMYRGVTYYFMENNLSISNINHIDLCADIKFEFMDVEGTIKTFLNGKDISSNIESPLVIFNTSKYALNKKLRKLLNTKQLELAKYGNVIVEGRDSGTKVFPNADIKFYLDADIKVRYERLYSLLDSNEKASISKDDFFQRLANIDSQDCDRKAAPLAIPENAIIHKNFRNLSAYQDAVILFYYIKRQSEIISNAKAISNPKNINS